MQLSKLKRFESKELGSIYIPSLQSTRNETKFTEKSKITCFKYCHENQTVAAGLNNGCIILFYSERYPQKKLTQIKEYESKMYSHVNDIHKGDIRCLIYEKIFDNYYIITGSSDRTIKIWDSDFKTKEIVQTIIGHSGTIMALAYSKMNDSLFSASNDKTIKIWKQEKNRKFFMHPWYQVYQVISDFSIKKLNQNPVYVTSFEIKDGERQKFILYAGDSEGALHVIKCKEIIEKQMKRKENKVVYLLEKSNFGYHRLTINYIHRVPKQNVLFTLSYDQMAIGYEQATQKQFMKQKNPRKNLFTCCVWYYNTLLLADEKGYIYGLEINTEREIEEVLKYDSRILEMRLIKELDEVLICTESFIDVVKVKKGTKSGEDNSHTDAIIGIFALEPYKITNQKIKDSPKLITISLDNTMRVWDPFDLVCLLVMENPEKAEMSCLHYLPSANLFVTGHENGIMRMWNIELGNSITIDQQDNPFKHNNTICTIQSYEHKRSNQDITTYMFSAGYEGRIVVWEIFEKKNIVQSELMSSTISPQLKHSFYVDEEQKQQKVGYEILAIVIYEKEEERYIIAAGNSKKLYFIRMFTYEHLEPIDAHMDSIYSLVVDSNILFSSSLDGTIKLWNIQDRSLLTYLDIGESGGGIRGMYLIEETGHILTNSFDGEITYWDYTRKQIVKKVQEKHEKILAVTYVNQTKTLYVGTQEYNIHSYSLDELYNKPIIKGLVLKTQSDLDPYTLDQKLMQQLVQKNLLELQELQKRKN